MLTSHIFVVLVAATLATTKGPRPLAAQSAQLASQPDSVSIQASMQKARYAIGEKPIAVLTMKNISPNAVWYSTDPYLERIHITRTDGEPPKTELYRHLLGDVRPGDGPILESGPVAGRFIAPGTIDSQRFDLAYYYDLSKPGDYSVYIEMYDPSGPKDGSGHWLRTATAQFAVEAPR